MFLREAHGIPDTRHPQRGFTLLEILVALGVMAMITAIVFPAVSGMIAFGQKQTTKARLNATAQALTLAYRNHAMAVDTEAGRKMCLNYDCTEAFVSATDFDFHPGSVSASTAHGAATAAAMQAVSRVQGIPVSRLDVDGYGKHFKYFVSQRQQSVPSGHGVRPIYYHVITIVSSEGRAHLGGATFNTATGAVTLPPGALSVVVSGLGIQQDLYSKTAKKAQRVADIYGQFFTTRYLASLSRDASIDYFSSSPAPEVSQGQALFDSTSPIGNSAGHHDGWAYSGTPYPGDPASPLLDTSKMLTDCQPATDLKGFQTTLGLPDSALTSAWGFPLAVCNGPDADGTTGSSGIGMRVRNPASSATDLTLPPYTASIEAWTPGGDVISIPITGRY